MRFDIEDFVKLPKWKLYMFAPSLSSVDDVCLLTHSDINEIKHHVHGSDDNIYDAFALHTWLNSQYKQFVIPGKDIHYVETISWFWYYCYRLYRCNVYSQVKKNFKKFAFQTQVSKADNSTQSTQTENLTFDNNTQSTRTENSTFNTLYDTKVNLNRVIKTIVKHKYTIKKRGNFTHTSNSAFKNLPHSFLK